MKLLMRLLDKIFHPIESGQVWCSNPGNPFDKGGVTVLCVLDRYVLYEYLGEKLSRRKWQFRFLYAPLAQHEEA